LAKTILPKKSKRSFDIRKKAPIRKSANRNFYQIHTLKSIEETGTKEKPDPGSGNKDDLAKSPKSTQFVVPVKTGIQVFRWFLAFLWTTPGPRHSPGLRIL
jgi:hypothetical protein